VKRFYVDDIVKFSVQDSTVKVVNCLNSLNATAIVDNDFTMFELARDADSKLQYAKVGTYLSTIIYSHCFV
jgi:hypothetical protein